MHNYAHLYDYAHLCSGIFFWGKSVNIPVFIRGIYMRQAKARHVIKSQIEFFDEHF